MSNFQAPYLQELLEVQIKDSDLTLQAAIQTGIEEWKQLDSEYLEISPEVQAANPYTRTVKGTSKLSLAIPRNFRFELIQDGNRELLNQLSHEWIPEDKKSEYYDHLKTIFRKIPKASQLQDRLPRSQLKLGEYIQQGKLYHQDSMVFPEMDLNYTQSQSQQLEGKKTENDGSCLLEDDKIYVMNVYNPSDHSLEQSLKFVGRQSLEDVQRSIYCLHDHLPYHETCNRSKAIEFIKDQGVSTLPSLPASLFVINEAIYTDHPEDYHFVQDNDDSSAQTGFNSLQNTLDSLSLNSVKSFVYIHYGCCEHIIQLVDIHRYHDRFDSSDSSNYPIEVFRSIPRKRRCQICDVLSAEHIVYNDRLADSNPCLFCRTCFNMLHFSEDGQLLYDDFYLFPYLHDR